MSFSLSNCRHEIEIGHSRPVNNQTVFECKVRVHLLSFRGYIDYVQYEIDSLCGFLKLSRSYYLATKDASFMNANCNDIFLVPIALLIAQDRARCH